jgi:hypothetical protein
VLGGLLEGAGGAEGGFRCEVVWGEGLGIIVVGERGCWRRMAYGPSVWLSVCLWTVGQIHVSRRRAETSCSVDME